MSQDLQKQFIEIVRLWRADAVVETVVPLTPDASLRRYFRITLQPSANMPRTVVAMYFDSVASPEAGGTGGPAARSDDSYVELTKLLGENGVKVPKLYFDARVSSKLPVLLIEDFGDTLLMTAVEKMLYSPERLDALYEQAIDEILKFQEIAKRRTADSHSIAFDRSFTSREYRKELTEFEEFYLAGKASEMSLGVTKRVCDRLAEELDKFKRTLVHRDYHSWNLLVVDGAAPSIGVIDFQDALMATESYDLVALLNDRDTDAALGEERYQRLLNYFQNVSRRGEGFYSEYYRVLLQRDLKVVGRFHKLAQVRGLTGYLRWVPGTLRRIGSSLARLATDGKTKDYGELLATLAEISPEILEGSKRLYPSSGSKRHV